MKKTALIFPGQGSQSVGMGKDLYEKEAAARIVFDRANEILGFNVKQMCFSGPEEQLMTTKYSQPAIFTLSIATLNVLIEKIKGSPVGEADLDIFSTDEVKLAGSLAMGLSLGEVTSLVASGVMNFTDGLNFVKNRGEFMDEASKLEDGKMASILGLELSKIEEICMGIGCQVANLNCPGQVVISGTASKVALASDLAKNAGAKRAIVLNVSGAFHSDLMLPAKQKLSVVLEKINMKEPVIDFISNIDAELAADSTVIKKNLADQLDNRTLWEASVLKAISLGYTDFLEIGPGSVLKSLLKKINKDLNVTTLHTTEDIEAYVLAIKQ
ncbi:MAG: ACP S-malonyltransferase [Candidatus Omnitrophica bacterium]|nr:ACP S-malonyltransferase [Candidatus Omnitrophota bacterium]